MNRRKLLKHLAYGAAALCPTCLTAAASLAAEDKNHGGGNSKHWTYEGGTGPDHWGEMSPGFRVCDLGLQQSPIDLRGPIRAELNGVSIRYRPTAWTVVNNGHTIQVNCAPGCSIEIDGTEYDLLQFHFHHPSEHMLGGKRMGMETHFVHASSSGMLAVLGVFMIEGGHNSVLQPVWSAMPTEAGQESPVNNAGTSPAQLLPSDRAYYRYLGSLTKPPCSEKVLWTVYKEPISVSSAQMGRFAAMFPMNARPIKPLNRRFLLDTL